MESFHIDPEELVSVHRAIQYRKSLRVAAIDLRVIDVTFCHQQMLKHPKSASQTVFTALPIFLPSLLLPFNNSKCPQRLHEIGRAHV